MGTKGAKLTGVEITRTQTGNGTLGMGHDLRVDFIDNRAQVLAQLNENASRATLAVGTKAVGLIVNQMQTGYGRPIRQTGDLQRDVNYEVVDDVTVNVGNSLEYAPFVHDGTRKMGARPYIRDALMNSDNQRTLQRVYEEYLKQGFDG
jgi:HK97 gp10 family phage protein